MNLKLQADARAILEAHIVDENIAEPPSRCSLACSCFQPTHLECSLAGFGQWFRASPTMALLRSQRFQKGS
jgi:hypothetical protein